MSTSNTQLENKVSQKETRDKHIHTYRKHPSRKGYSFCMGKDCYSIVETKLLIGKRNRCKCGNIFFLTQEDLRRAIPRCLDCSATKAAIAYKKGKQLIESISDKENPELSNTEISTPNSQFELSSVLMRFRNVHLPHEESDEDVL